MHERMPKRNRVPVSRRTTREIAGGLKAVVVATMLAHLIRCVRSTKRDGWRFDGTCSATFVAETFGADERGVRRARRHLEAIGWLRVEASDHWHRQRFGGRAVINRSWSRNDAGLPGPVSKNAHGLPGPESKVKLPSGRKNQKPVTTGRSDFWRGEEGRKTKTPTMKHVELVDLKDTSRTLRLFDDAVGRGITDASEHGRLLFVAAAERALIRGSSNPCGLFVKLVRDKLWHHITQGDEDAAHVRLKYHRFGDPRAGDAFELMPRSSHGSQPAQPKPAELSDDAKLVQAIRTAAGRLNHRGDPFYLCRHHERTCDWTRERWDRALVEIENARLKRQAQSCVSSAMSRLSSE